MYRFSWLDDLTLDHIEKCSENVYKGCPIIFAKFGGAVHRRFFAICEKKSWIALTLVAGRGLRELAGYFHRYPLSRLKAFLPRCVSISWPGGALSSFVCSVREKCHQVMKWFALPFIWRPPWAGNGTGAAGAILPRHGTPPGNMARNEHGPTPSWMQISGTQWLPSGQGTIIRRWSVAETKSMEMSHKIPASHVVSFD